MNSGTHLQTVHHVLVVEDEADFARAVKKCLLRAGFEASISENIGRARQALSARPPHLLLLDMRLPDGSGLELLQELNRDESMLPVLVMSAYGELEDAVSAMKLGALDYLRKPIDMDMLLEHVKKLIQRSYPGSTSGASVQRAPRAKAEVPFLGECPELQAVRADVARIAELSQGRAAALPSVLVLGETGTGKDVLARLLHMQSSRKEQPFVHLDCASLPKDLIEAELFGHEKGAFTDAHSMRVGLIESADQGVLFLDEIGELPLPLQAKLLAVLERRVLRRIGDIRERQVSAWFIAATNRDLKVLVGHGEFRADLYYRLNVLSLELPPLRERGEDILLLAEYFALQTASHYGLGDRVRFSAAAKQCLLRHLWPGNVRELKHSVERAVLLSQGETIEPDMLEMITAEATEVPSEDASLDLNQAEKRLIQQALDRTSGNVAQAARELGITRMTLRTRMKKHGL